MKTKKELLDPYTFTECGFRFGEITEAETRQIAAGIVPDRIQRTARSLLTAAEKWSVRFEPVEQEKTA